MTPPKFNREWSHVCTRWVLWRFRLRSVGPTNADFFKQAWETAHKQGTQEHQNNLCTTSYNLRGAYSGRRFYGFTPSLPLFSSTALVLTREDRANQVTAGLLWARTALWAHLQYGRHARSGKIGVLGMSWHPGCWEENPKRRDKCTHVLVVESVPQCTSYGFLSRKKLCHQTKTMTETHHVPMPTVHVHVALT